MADSEPTQGKSTKRAAAKTDDDVGATTQAAESPPPIPVGQLISDGSALLGYPSHAVAGALYGREPDEELEIDAAKTMVEDWLAQPVQVDPATTEAEEA